MKECLIKIALFFSAFIPLYFLLLIKILLEILNSNLSFNILNSIMLSFLAVLIICGVIGIYVNAYKTKNELTTIKVINSSNLTDKHFFEYFSLFVLFAISFDLSKFCMSCVFIVVLIFIGIVYVKNNLFFINPFLNIIGYSFYEIKFKIGDSEKVKSIKVFYKGLIRDEQEYEIKLRDNNFSFLKNKRL